MDGRATSPNYTGARASYRGGFRGRTQRGRFRRPSRGRFFRRGFVPGHRDIETPRRPGTPSRDDGRHRRDRYYDGGRRRTRSRTRSLSPDDRERRRRRRTRSASRERQTRRPSSDDDIKASRYDADRKSPKQERQENRGVKEAATKEVLRITVDNNHFGSKQHLWKPIGGDETVACERDWDDDEPETIMRGRGRGSQPYGRGGWRRNSRPSKDTDEVVWKIPKVLGIRDMDAFADDVNCDGIAVAVKAGPKAAPPPPRIIDQCDMFDDGSEGGTGGSRASYLAAPRPTPRLGGTSDAVKTSMSVSQTEPSVVGRESSDVFAIPGLGDDMNIEDEDKYLYGDDANESRGGIPGLDGFGNGSRHTEPRNSPRDPRRLAKSGEYDELDGRTSHKLARLDGHSSPIKSEEQGLAYERRSSRSSSVEVSGQRPRDFDPRLASRRSPSTESWPSVKQEFPQESSVTSRRESPRESSPLRRGAVRRSPPRSQPSEARSSSSYAAADTSTTTVRSLDYGGQAQQNVTEVSSAACAYSGYPYAPGYYGAEYQAAPLEYGVQSTFVHPHLMAQPQVSWVPPVERSNLKVIEIRQHFPAAAGRTGVEADDVRVPATAEDREKLKATRAQENKKLDMLMTEVDRLRRQQGELMRKKQKQKDGHNDPQVLSNGKLLDDFDVQVSKSKRKLQLLDRALKASESLVRATSPTAKNVREQPTPKQYRFMDKGDHWCKHCGDIFPLATDLLMHLHADHNNVMAQVAPADRPWAIKPKEPKSNLGASVTVVPFSGVEFMLPCAAFFCNLCKEFSGDTIAARTHLESEKHNANYQRFCKSNPNYAKRVASDRIAGMARRRKENKRKAEEAKVTTAAKKKKAPEALSSRRDSDMEISDAEDGPSGPCHMSKLPIRLNLLYEKDSTANDSDEDDSGAAAKSPNKIAIRLKGKVGAPAVTKRAAQTQPTTSLGAKENRILSNLYKKFKKEKSDVRPPQVQPALDDFVPLTLTDTEAEVGVEEAFDETAAPLQTTPQLLELSKVEDDDEQELLPPGVDHISMNMPLSIPRPNPLKSSPVNVDGSDKAKAKPDVEMGPHLPVDLNLDDMQCLEEVFESIPLPEDLDVVLANQPAENGSGAVSCQDGNAREEVLESQSVPDAQLSAVDGAVANEVAENKSDVDQTLIVEAPSASGEATDEDILPPPTSEVLDRVGGGGGSLPSDKDGDAGTEPRGRVASEEVVSIGGEDVVGAAPCENVIPEEKVKAESSSNESLAPPVDKPEEASTVEELTVVKREVPQLEVAANRSGRPQTARCSRGRASAAAPRSVMTRASVAMAARPARGTRRGRGRGRPVRVKVEPQDCDMPDLKLTLVRSIKAETFAETCQQEVSAEADSGETMAVERGKFTSGSNVAEGNAFRRDDCSAKKEEILTEETAGECDEAASSPMSEPNLDEMEILDEATMDSD